MFSDLNYLTIYIGTIHVLYFLNTLIGSKKIPVFAIIDLVAVWSVVLALKYLKKRTIFKLGLLDSAVLFYVLFSLFSFGAYFFPGNPSTVVGFAYGLHLLVIPVMLYYCVKRLSASEQISLLKRISFLNVIFIIYGFLMFYIRPGYYTEFLINSLFAEQGVNDLWILYSRIQSYFGSSAVGTISWITIIISIVLGYKGFAKISIFIFCIAAALLSQQRGGILGVLLVLGYYILINKDNLYQKIKLSTVALVFISSVLFIYGNKVKDTMPFDLIEYTKARIVNEMFLGNPFEDRKVSREKGWQVVSDFPFGLGVGASTSGADSAGANPGGQISDANFFRIWADLGSLGLAIFIFVLLAAINSAMKWHDPWPWILVVVIYCIQGLGSNIFDNFYVSHLFWLLLGVMDSYRLHNGRLSGVPIVNNFDSLKTPLRN